MKKIILIIISVILVITTIVIGVKLYNKVKDQEEQIQVLTKQIEDMSREDLVDVFVASQPIKAGSNVTETQFQTRKWDKKYLSENMVTDISDIKDKVWKIDIATGGPITSDMIAKETYGPTDRLQLVGVDAMSPSLQAGDYVDIRMVTPSGINYVVMSKKRINRIYESGVEIVMSEAELMVYSGLLIDQFSHPGTIVYTSKYLEPTLQKSNYTMYVPPKDILNYMQVNENMIYPYLASDDVQGLRSYIENSQPWNLYGPSTFQTETEAIIDAQTKATAANEDLAERMNSARQEYQAAEESGSTEGQPPADQSQPTQTSDLLPGEQQTYIDADGVERLPDGTAVIQPSDLVTGATDTRAE